MNDKSITFSRSTKPIKQAKLIMSSKHIKSSKSEAKSIKADRESKMDSKPSYCDMINSISPDARVNVSGGYKKMATIPLTISAAIENAFERAETSVKIIDAYQQVVAGTNYLVRVQVEGKLFVFKFFRSLPKVTTDPDGSRIVHSGTLTIVDYQNC
jgi:hypothetical protein